MLSLIVDAVSRIWKLLWSTTEAAFWPWGNSLQGVQLALQRFGDNILAPAEFLYIQGKEI